MVNVKEEVDWEIGVKVECEYVKEEPEWGGHAPAPAGCGVSAAAARAGLYTGHEVRGDLVLGPTALQPPDTAFAPPDGRKEARAEGPRLGARCGEPPQLRACSVALERLSPNRCGRAGAQRDRQDSKQHHTRTNTQDLPAGEYSHNICEEPFQLRACSVALERLPPDRCGRNTHTDSPDLAAKEYCCDACGKWFKIKSTLIRHLLQHRTDSDPSGTTNMARLSSQSQPVHHQTIHRSEISLTQFPQQIPLVAHHQHPLIDNDNGEKPHKCKFCIKSFRKKSALVIHQLIHTGEKPYECDVCTKQFSRHDTLVRHEEIHKVKKSYKCQRCAKQFTQRMCLDRHQLIHTGQKPHKCDICLKRFRFQSNLIVHQQFHIGTKLYKCELCKKQYANRHHLVAHGRVHSGERPFKCDADACGKRFSRRDHLVRHQAVHTGDKPYKCDTCKKEFTREAHLERHKLIHTGERPYECEICMKKFTQQGNLVSHLRVHYKKLVKKKYKW